MRKIKHKQVLILLFYILLFARLKAENGVIELETQKSVIDLEKESIETKGNVSLKYNDVTIQADNLKKLAKKNIIFFISITSFFKYFTSHILNFKI